MYNMYNKLPHFVYLKNEKYFINTDYRIFIEFEEKMQGKDAKQVIYDCLSRFYPAFFIIQSKGLFNEAIDQFIWFYKCGKEENKSNKQSKKDSNITSRVYSYEQAYHYDL